MGLATTKRHAHCQHCDWCDVELQIIPMWLIHGVSPPTPWGQRKPHQKLAQYGYLRRCRNANCSQYRQSVGVLT